MGLIFGRQESKEAEQSSDNVAFDIAPNGRQIAFSAADGNLYLLDLKTYQVTRLTQTGNCSSPAFSPDGTKIVYSGSAAGENGAALYELSLTRKTTRRLTQDPKTSDSRPSYSPDGAWITFTRAFRYRPYSMGGMIWCDYDICILRADGTSLKRLTNKRYYSAGRPGFTRDGKSIVFSAAVPYDTQFFDRNSGGSLTTLLQVSATAPGEPRILLPLPKPGKEGGALGTAPTLSPTGRQIAFISDRVSPFRYDINTMDRDGAHLRSLNITKISAYNGQPTYLPDGKSLLFLAGTETDSRSRPLYSLWRVNADGSHPQKVADETLFLTPSRWKPRPPEPRDARSVQTALTKGAKPGQRDALGRSLLSNAASRGDAETVRLLLQKGADPNTPDADGTTVLMRALEKNHLDVVRLLIAKGAKVNAIPQGGPMQGMPPLIIAAIGGNTPTVEALLQAGANIKVTDAQLGQTALHWACDRGNIDLARLLLAKGIPVDVRNTMGGTPLMGAAGAGKPELVKFLIAKGANVRARDDRTRQMYGMAQFTGDTASMEKIRRSGKLNTLHEDGRSVLDWAQIGGNAEVITLLKKAGATQ